jgi:hypothetical protein
MSSNSFVDTDENSDSEDMPPRHIRKMAVETASEQSKKNSSREFEMMPLATEESDAESNERFDDEPSNGIGDDYNNKDALDFVPVHTTTLPPWLEDFLYPPICQELASY